MPASFRSAIAAFFGVGAYSAGLLALTASSPSRFWR